MNESNPAFWMWVDAYGMPSYLALPRQKYRRCVGGPLDGRLENIDVPVVQAALPAEPPGYLTEKSVPMPYALKTTTYYDRTVLPCWSAHPVRVLVWEVLLDDEDDADALNRILVDVFGAPAIGLSEQNAATN